MATSEPLFDIDRFTGELISGWQRCRQSIHVILTTRLRTRIMRLWFGSEFLDAQDKPNNSDTIYRSISAAIHAVNQYEPEFFVNRLIVGGNAVNGEAEITIEGTYLPDEEKRKATIQLT